MFGHLNAFVAVNAINAGNSDQPEGYSFLARKFFQKAEDFFPTVDLLAQHHYLLVAEPIPFGTGRPPDAVVYVNPEVMQMQEP